MNLTKPTHLKIIVKKKAAKKTKNKMVGITITRAHPPTKPPPSNIIGKSKDKGGISLPSSMPKNGMTYAQTLRQTFVKKTKGEDKIPEFEPPNLNEHLERKLQLLPKEWYKDSSY